MANTKYVYAIGKDGSASLCRAQDPDNCPYHIGLPHRMMTATQAKAMNEAAAAVGKAKNSLVKKNAKANTADYDRMIVTLTTADADKIYDKAMSIINSIEENNRQPLKDVDNLAPSPDEYEVGDTISDRDAEELKDIRKNSFDSIVGRPLLGSEESMLMSRLDEYDKSDLSFYEDRSRTAPSPMQEKLINTIVLAPNVSKSTMDKLVHNHYIMQYDAKDVINSGHADEDAVRTAYETAPASALEAQRLPTELVDATLKMDSTPLGIKRSEFIRKTNIGEDPVRAIGNALRHPNASPEVGYKAMRAIMDDDQWTDEEKADFAWQQCMNPNEEYRRAIAKLDSGRPVSEQLMVTRDWNEHHAPEDNG